MAEKKKIPIVENYSCPKCGDPSWDQTEQGTSTLQATTKPVFITEPEPHYSWLETHKCLKCGTIYEFKNNT